MSTLQKHYGPLLRILHVSVDQAISQALENMELTSAQGHILGFTLIKKEPPCPKDIEAAFQLSHPTVSGLLSRMEKKGFIEILPDTKDRRCKRIFVLPKGIECGQMLHQKIQDTEHQLAAGFTPEEQAQFCEFLERAITNLGGWPNFPKKPKEENHS